MTSSELQDRLEDLCSNLQIISETTNAAYCSLEYEILNKNQICWILTGIIRQVDSSIKDTEQLVDEAMELHKMPDDL